MARPRDETPPINKMPGFGWLPHSVRNHFVAMAGEFVGTFLFLFFALSACQVANSSTPSQDESKLSQPTAANPAQLLYISLAFGFSLAVNVWVFFRISGGLFNPAVSIKKLFFPLYLAEGGNLFFSPQRQISSFSFYFFSFNFTFFSFIA